MCFHLCYFHYFSLLKMLRRLRRPILTYERHTSTLRVSVGHAGHQVLRTCRSTLLWPSCQCSGKRRHQRRADIVQSEREVTVSAQSQVSSTVSTVSRCTGQVWTATCPQRHHWQTRFVATYCLFVRLKTITIWREDCIQIISSPHFKTWSLYN